MKTSCSHPEFRIHVGCLKCPEKDCQAPYICHCKTCVKQRTPKPLAQYLDEYIKRDIKTFTYNGLVSWRELLEQALDAYQSTENVTIKIERNTK